jgi:hypothetical protein
MKDLSMPFKLTGYCYTEKIIRQTLQYLSIQVVNYQAQKATDLQ